MIWHRLSVLSTIHPRRSETVRLARRWSAMARGDSNLPRDLIRLGGVLELRPFDLDTGERLPMDPLKLAYEAGRRDFAMQLLALMGTSFEDMNRMMEDDDA